MKTLYSIVESRGVVTGANDWSKVVQELFKSFAEHNEKDKYELSCDLPWLSHVTVICNTNWMPGGSASYDDEQSKISNGKMEVVINIYNKLKLDTGTLEHELQHAYDHWVKITKRAQSQFLDHDYKVGTGYEYDYTPFTWISWQPEKANCDSFFDLFAEYTNALNQSEVNAYAREFALYLKDNELDMESACFDSHILEQAGMFPILLLNALYNVEKNSSKFKLGCIDDSDGLERVDYNYIVCGIQSGQPKFNGKSWSQYVLGKNIQGKDDKDTVFKTVQYMIKTKGKYAINKYKRIIADNKDKVKNIPEYLK